MEPTDLSRVCPQCRRVWGDWFKKFTYCPICGSIKLVAPADLEPDPAQKNAADAPGDAEPWLLC